MTGFILRQPTSGEIIEGTALLPFLKWNSTTELWELAPEPAGGGGAFTDSGSIGVATLDPGTPTILTLANAPAAFVGLAVAGFIGLTFTNGVGTDLLVNGAVTVEVSLDSGVTYNSIGDPPGYTSFNPTAAPQQQVFLEIPFVFRTGAGPATGNVLVRATFGDNTTGGTLAGGQLTAQGVFTSA